MIPRDARQESFESIELFGKPALFTIMRIDRQSVPPGLFVYDIRHDDNGNPATLEKNVLVNHYGTVILNRPIALTRGDYRRATSRDLISSVERVAHCKII